MKAIFFVLFVMFGCAYCRSLPVKSSETNVASSGNPISSEKKARQFGNGGYGGYGGFNNFDYNPYNDTPNNYDSNPFNDSPHRQTYNNFDFNPFNDSPNNYDANPFNNSGFFGKK